MLSKRDLAKYPWTSEAVELVKTLDISISKLVKDYKEVVERARERVMGALEYDQRVVSWHTDINEILSFPTARLLIVLVGDDLLKSRWADVESKRAQSLLEHEEDDKLIWITTETFGWDMSRIRQIIEDTLYDWKIHFSDYLRFAPRFHDIRWKLINREISGGFVFLEKREIARLVAEAVKWRMIERKISEPLRLEDFPSEIQDATLSLKELWMKRRRKIREYLGVEGPVNREAFPPCMKQLISTISKSKSLSHQGRFAVTTFLLKIGVPKDRIIEMFKSTPDFREGIARYQIEHIGGFRGGRTKYTPPSCNTLRTYGLCPKGDPICDRVKHPLGFYRLKRRSLGRK
ncbi:MAG: hypothetical protein ACFFA1_04050 [Promethearchaeota archaeon]